MSSGSVFCSKCAGSVRGVCSRPTPYCLGCCRQTATEDGFVCTGHPARKPRAGHEAAPADQHQESEEPSSDVSDHEPDMSSDRSLSESDTEEKFDTSEQNSDTSEVDSPSARRSRSRQSRTPLRRSHSRQSRTSPRRRSGSRLSRSKRQKPRRPPSDSEDDDIPAHLMEPRPSLTTMQKALAKVKPWQKGVVQDGLPISCRAFLMQFESSLEMVNADTRDLMRMIPSWLVGEAALWYDNLRQQGSPCLHNWPAFKQALLLTYGDLPATHTAWDAVQSCSLKAGESLESHCDRFRNKVIELQDRIPSWLCNEVYIKMMRLDTRRHLYSIFYDKIQLADKARDFSLDMICRAAIHYEKTIAPPTVIITPVPASKSVSTPTTPSLSASTPAVTNPTSQPSPTANQSSRRGRKNRNKRSRDDNEGEDQEEKKDGETPRRQRDRSTVTCWKCGKLGHFKSECPESPPDVKEESKSSPTDRSRGRGGA
jgi:hypothetical protein